MKKLNDGITGVQRSATTSGIRVPAVILAGGEGRRLRPLTRHRVKPAVSFGGRYRLIDFTLSNLVNSGVQDIVVITRRGSTVLDRHIADVWADPTGHGQTRTMAPADPAFPAYAGSAAAVLAALESEGRAVGEHVFVFGADHVYRIDPAHMLREHTASGADVTVAATRVPLAAASAFGVVETDERGRIPRFFEKSANPHPMYGDSDHALASMGIYVFTIEELRHALRIDRVLRSSRSDIGGDILPFLVAYANAHVFDFSNAPVLGQGNATEGTVGTEIDPYRRMQSNRYPQKKRLARSPDSCRPHGGYRHTTPSIGFVSTYPPTECGIATFTRALRTAIADERCSADRLKVVSLVDARRDDAAPEVMFQHVTGDPRSLELAGKALNDMDIAVVQHEYGIYGGADGAEVLDLVTSLKVPSVVVGVGRVGSWRGGGC